MSSLDLRFCASCTQTAQQTLAKMQQNRAVLALLRHYLDQAVSVSILLGVHYDAITFLVTQVPINTRAWC